jgi:hypothetical protein
MNASAALVLARENELHHRAMLRMFRRELAVREVQGYPAKPALKVYHNLQHECWKHILNSTK